MTEDEEAAISALRARAMGYSTEFSQDNALTILEILEKLK